MGDIELVQAYMDETPIITNGMSNEHMQQLETVLKRHKDKASAPTGASATSNEAIT
jgi:hypothetical protein